MGLRDQGFEVMIGILQKWRQDLRTVTTGWLWCELTQEEGTPQRGS